MARVAVFVVALAALISLSLAVPLGFATYFNLQSCPAGWREVPESKGRVLVSVIDDAIAGLTVGEPLENGEDRTHSHTVLGSTTIGSHNIAADSCCNKDGALHGTYKTSGVGASHTSNLPFTQLLLCAATNVTAFEVPFGTVSFFSPDVPGCPGNWTGYEPAAGRSIIPGYDQSGPTPSESVPLASREDRVHNHSFTASYTTDEVSYAGIDGCCNNDPSHTGTYGITGNAVPATSGVPYIQMLTCLSKEQTFDIQLPHGALIFSPVVGCPDGWEVSVTLSGRFIVDLPFGGIPGFSFGGPSIRTDASRPVHDHAVNGTVNLPSSDIGLASGCCAGGYAKAGSVPYSGQTSDDTVDFPFLMVPLCERADDRKTKA